MTMTSATANANPHIAALEKALDAAPAPIEWLVIAHRDPRMLRSLSSILEGQSAAILEVSQDEWNWSEGELSEAIEWALQRSEVRNLVLAAHSQAASSARRSYCTPAAPGARNFPANDGYARLLVGVKQVHSQTHRAQARFADDVQQLSKIPLVNRRLTGGELDLYGLFYRSESGLFLTYDPDADTYRALMA